MSSYYFTEEHELFRQGLRDFLQQEVIPHIDDWEEAGRIPKELWKKFGDMGYLGLNYPEAYGGSDADFFYSVVFLEEIARCFSGGFTITPSVQQFMASPYLYKHGSDFLKEKYLRKAIAGEWICAIAITEPGAGSDAANIQTRAVRQGDYYVVNGSKTFITNGVYGDFLITVVKTDPEAGVNGVSLLVIDRQAPGVSARKLKKLGWHASDTAELSFDDVRVPVENLIGEEGQGFFYLMGGLQLERLAGAISAVSGSQHALEYSLQYLSERQAFGRPLNKFQVLRHRVAQLSSEIEATRAFIYHCCRMHNDNQYAVKESSMAKLLATELSDKVMYQCLQFFGGYGYMEEYKIARMFRDSRIGTIGGGTSEIMREIIAKMVIDDKSYQREAPAAAPRASQATSPVNNGHANGSTTATQTKTTMSTDMILGMIQKRAAKASPLGSSLKFDFGGQYIFIDGSGSANTVSTDNADADCTVSITSEDFQALLSGELNPMSAFMSGKIKVKGDMGVAMKLQSFLG
ncbi:MAG: acyl-CoA dehydrogenase family protein [Lewinellaceae bacterium]|nr:acyl-CoA dehydrogenase family protein [Lewinellaceae bacterium]